jgi:WhiB family transcriptional regulator, redox-sensing transcriptional regulator
MAPMQWREATVGGRDATEFEASRPDARREPDVRQIQVGYVGQVRPASRPAVGPVRPASGSAVGPVRPASGSAVGTVSVVGGSGQFVMAGSATPLPVGFDLPCTRDPELFFAESPADLEQAKAMCRGCRARIACLAGALERREPWGVWGGELLMRGVIVPRKRPRGRPRKTEVAA